MKRYFKGSLYTFGIMFLAAAVMVGLGVATPEGSFINDLSTGLFVTLFCASPLVVAIAVITGAATAFEHFTGQEKRKREFVDFDLAADDRLDDIMKRLSPEQQVYLENRLRNSRLGVGNDGELMSINDLLDDFDQKEKRM